MLGGLYGKYLMTHLVAILGGSRVLGVKAKGLNARRFNVLRTQLGP